MNEFKEIWQLVQQSRAQALQLVNRELVGLYYRVGAAISQRLSSGNWGEKTVDELARWMKEQDATIKGFDRRGLYRMKQFYEAYSGTPLAPAGGQQPLPEEAKAAMVSPPVTQSKADTSPIVTPLVTQIPWTHNLVILSKTKSAEERAFYLQLTFTHKLTKRELEREIDSGKWERTVLAGKQVPLLHHPGAGKIQQIFKDTYIAEFLNLPEPYSEGDLQKALVSQMKSFILELGRDFLFIGEEFRVQVGLKDFYLDLLFYHRELNCLVAFELKIEDFKPEHLGKLNFYLEALDRDVKKPHENPSIGVLLCKSKDEEVVEYAMSRNLSPALIAEYQTKLPDKKLLQQKMHEILNQTNGDEQKDPNKI